MRNNIQRTGVEFVFRLKARIPGMAGDVGLEVAHLHGGGHILLHLTVVAGIAHIGRKTEVVVHPAAVKAHAPEVEAVVRAVKITVGFGIPDTDVERCTKAEHVVDGVIRTQGNAAQVAVVAGFEVLRLHAPNVVGLV